ncbi:Glutamyl-tRNA reductase-binding protein [Nymphaea thermarum]|nr:Glutamyl-tRNA reductase-binding protein [Nymphaea thermarum]
MLPHALSFNPSLISPPPSRVPSLSVHQTFPKKNLLFTSFKQCPPLKSSLRVLKCSIGVAEAQPKASEERATRPSSAEVSRTIMELSSRGTLSAITEEGWPLGIGVRFAVDGDGMPILSLDSMNQGAPTFSTNNKSSLHVQLEQDGPCVTQCTLQGILSRPEDKVLRKRLQSIWKKKFETEICEDFLYVMAVERVLHMEDFKEDGIWVTDAEYRNSFPDPLRICAKKIVDEMNNDHMEDVHRFSNIFVDLEFQVVEARMMWVDRLGFDLHIRSSEEEIFAARIPFLREVTDEKAAKSSITYLSQLAWELEKNYTTPEFDKVKCLRKAAR